MPDLTRIQSKDFAPDLDEIAREGARRMLAEALDAEVAAYIERNQERDEQGRAQVVRNGKCRPRKLTLGSGTIEVRAPRVDDRRQGEDGRQTFRSQILPPYMRRSPKVAEVLPVLYLRGLSTGDFEPALLSLLGEEATAGLSASTITRLTAAWQHDYEQFRKRTFHGKRYAYLFADGVHFRIRLEEDRLCTLVLIGVREDGKKELVAVEDGYRESTESWLCVLRGLHERGLEAALLAIGDGALGFWAGVRDVWPETRPARDWCHKMANVLDKLPKRLQPQAKALLREAMYADTKQHASQAIDCLADEFGAKYPKAVACLRSDEELLLTHFDYPAEHWKHLRTTNVIESPFATVWLRQRVTKGAGSRRKGLLMAFQLLAMAERRWRRINGAQLIPLVRAGVQFSDGVQAEGRNAA